MNTLLIIADLHWTASDTIAYVMLPIIAGILLAFSRR